MGGIKKHFKEEKILKNLEKANQHAEYVDVLLRNCKKHQGPFLCLEELKNFLNNIKDEKE